FQSKKNNDENNFTPFNSVKLIFPEVDIFEKEGYIKEYVKEGGVLWSIYNISTPTYLLINSQN
ncbi:MAG: hypothetical protein RIQ51_1714, partial [Bacteroidota bacterium]